jgi:hypothetical protein
MTKQLDYHTIYEIFRRFRGAEAEPKGELEHVNAYTLLVAVALSAQATDAGVNKATRKLFETVDTPEKMLALGEEGLIEHIKTIGLYRQKAKNVIKLSQILHDQYGRPGALVARSAAIAAGAWAARQPMLFSTCGSSSRHRPSIPTSSVWAIAPASRRARTWKQSSAPSKIMSPPSFSVTRIIG